MSDSTLAELRGSIEQIIYTNTENGYAVCDLGTQDNELVTIQGTLPYIAEGDHVTVYGRWVHSPRYGRQFSVERYERNLPSDANSILRYLSSRAVKGIGPKTAEKIVEQFGVDTFDVIENHPDWLAQINGISQKKAVEISEDFRMKSGIRSAMIFFRDYFGAALTVRIYQAWGAEAIRRAKENPYRLCDEIEGIGFEKADAMAKKMGLAENSAARMMSGMIYVLRSNSVQNGHVCLPEDKLLAASAATLKSPIDTCRTALDALLDSGKIKSETVDGVRYCYDRYAYDCEQYIAMKLTLLDRVCVPIHALDVNGLVEKAELASGICYAPSQKKAICDALISGVMILTGGPGTGKTTVVRALIDIFDSIGYKVALCAPTGRAAKRMSESTSKEAKTIHRLLEMEYDAGDRGGGMFRRGEDNVLDENVVIVDEMSMVDNALMCALLKAVKPGARLILIGDADQLPSVGAGNVLHDLTQCKRFSTVCLTEIFRQAQKSLIVTNAHAINRGEMPRLDVKDNDFFFLYRQNDRDIAQTIADLYQNRLPRTYGAITEYGIQVISPSRRGEAGTDHLNVLLQQAMNPPIPGKAEYQHKDTVFREGDRVMQTRNNYELIWERIGGEGGEGHGVFNGDIGIIERVNLASECLEIRFDDRHVVYDFSILDELEHAWAITVHKSQGSEYPIVIIPMYRAPSMLLTRHLLYTAVTRAQRMVILVGKPEIVQIMIENQRQSMRYTGLAARLQ